jgi:hypothetical protein
MLHHRKSILSPPSISADFVHLDASGMSREAMLPIPPVERYPKNPYMHGRRKAQFDELRPAFVEGNDHGQQRMHGLPRDDGSMVATETSVPTTITAPPPKPASPQKKPLKSALKRSKPAANTDAASLASVPSKESRQPSVELHAEDLKENASGAVAQNRRFTALDSLFAPHNARLRNSLTDEKPRKRSVDAKDDDEVKRAKEEVRRLRELLSGVDVNKSDAADEMCSNPQDVSVNDEHENKRSSSRHKGKSPSGSKSSKKKGKKFRKSCSDSQDEDEISENQADGDVEISGFQFPDIGKAHKYADHQLLIAAYHMNFLISRSQATVIYTLRESAF